jgi:hypothetical protein
MREGIDKKSPHPTSRELAYFVEDKIIGTRKKEITEHLLKCDECSYAVVLVKKYGKKKLIKRIANNKNYRAIILSMIAGVTLFLLVPIEEKPHIEFYTLTQEISFKSPFNTRVKYIEAKNQELNSFLYELIKSTDMSFSEEFKNAEEYLKDKDFDNARESYSIALLEVEESDFDEIEKEKKIILINYKILLLSIKEGDSESISSYKDKIKDDIRRLKLKEKIK